MAGSVISFQHIRNGKVIYSYDNLHNAIGNRASGTIPFGSTRPYYIYLMPTAINEYLPGTFSKSGTTITRVSGSFDMTTLGTGDFLVWADGTKAGYVQSSGKTTTTCTVASSGTKAATALKWVKTYSLDTPTEATNFGTAYGSVYNFGTNVGSTIVREYANVTWPVVVTTDATIRRLTIEDNNSVSFKYFHYDLPTPLSVVAGDVIVVSNFKLTETWDRFSSLALPTCPISGLTTACTYQRMIPSDFREGSGYFTASLPTFIYLITTPNKYTIPASLPFPATTASSGTFVNPSVLTVAQSIPAIALTTTGSYVNSNISSNRVVGVTTAALADVKQIIWGTATQIHGVLEFDTPQSLDANKVLSLKSSTQYNIDTTY